jgi:hypothetical protein
MNQYPVGSIVHTPRTKASNSRLGLVIAEDGSERTVLSAPRYSVLEDLFIVIATMPEATDG